MSKRILSFPILSKIILGWHLAAFRRERNELFVQVFYPCHGEWIDLTINACLDDMKRALDIIEKDLVNVACKWQETDDVNRKWYRQVLQKARSRGKSGGKTPRTPGNRYFIQLLLTTLSNY